MANLLYGSKIDEKFFGGSGVLRQVDDTQFESTMERTSLLKLARQCMSIDADIAVKSSDFSPQAIFFDMDSTLIAQESLVEMARLIGKADEVHAVTELAMAGGMDFEASLRKRLALFAGVDASVFSRVLPLLSLNPGVSDFVSTAQSRGVKCFLISGGFNILAKSFASKLGFTEYCAHDLEEKNGILTGAVQGGIVGAQFKADWVKAISARYKCDATRVVAIGDGANDLPMLSSAGYAVGYQAKPILYPVLNAHVGRSGFSF